MSIDEDRDRLSQEKMLEKCLQGDLRMTDMITVYLSDTQNDHHYGIYCALIPSNQIEQVLSDPSWDLLHGSGRPDTITMYDQDGNERKYLRCGNDDGVEALIIERNFYGIRDFYNEISEEFRFYHNLYYDKKENKYIKFDSNGNEDTVATIESELKHIKIRLKEIRQFLAIKEMFLSIQFERKEYSKYSLEELGLKESSGKQREEHSCWWYQCGAIDTQQTYSLLRGKRLIAPLPKSEGDSCEFTDTPKRKYVDFIIGCDENGDAIEYSSNPNNLANFFGANSDAPNYLTLVHFRKKVLDKYYQKPSKYSVEDSILRCGNLWSLQIDNHHDSKVCVWLGDLGRDIPYEEQLHWRSENIPPEGTISGTYRQRQLLAQFADSDRIEHLFMQSYLALSKACDQHLGWQLLLPLDANDEYHLKSIRIPATNEQSDFDGLVLGLTKILIDSLNEKELNKLIPDTPEKENIKGSILRLETAFKNCGIKDTDAHISFLQKLQNLRSTGPAHRKGEKYQKIARKFNLENRSLKSAFSDILRQALAVLDYFIVIVCNKQMKKD